MACPLEFTFYFERFNGPARLTLKGAEFAQAAETGPDAEQRHLFTALVASRRFENRHTNILAEHTPSRLASRCTSEDGPFLSVMSQPPYIRRFTTALPSPRAITGES
jgi:hypothetical protein